LAISHRDIVFYHIKRSFVKMLCHSFPENTDSLFLSRNFWRESAVKPNTKGVIPLKTIRRFFPLFLVLLLLPSCRPVPSENMEETTLPAGEETSLFAVPTCDGSERTLLYDYPARILRGGSRYDQNEEYTEILSTVSELHDYLRALLGVEDLAAWSAPYSSMTIVDLTADYDEAFFSAHSLSVSYLIEGSGSFRHEYFGVSSEGQILLRRIVPEVYTDDMAAWNVFVEIPKDSPLLTQSVTLSALVTSDTAVWNELLDTSPDDPAYSASLPLLALTDSDGDPSYFPAGGKAPTRALTSHDFGFLDLLLPYGWQSQEVDTEDAFGIRFFKTDEPDLSADLLCHRNYHGICGTGVTAESLTLSDGTTAIRYTEQQGGNLWCLYFFNNKPGEYTLQYTVEKDKAERFDAAIRSILEHSQIAEQGLLSAQDILAIAEKDLSAKSGTVAARFDVTKGIWRVFHTDPGREQDICFYDFLGRQMSGIK